MKRIFSLVTLGALSACAVAAQTTASAPTNAQTGTQGSSMTASGSASAKPMATSKKGTSSVTIAEGTKIDATLVSWLDARRSRVGDPVQARVEQDVKQGGKVVLKKGTQLGGRVTVAQSRSSQGQSQVGIAFERALLSNGQSIPFHASIVALSASQPSSSATGAGANNAMASGSAMGATPASARASGAAATGAAMNTSNATASTTSGAANTAVSSSRRLSPDSKGVFGLEGLSLGSAKSGAQGSTIVSTTKNVRLKSGTEMLLRTSTQAR